ncbi:uncharacterized protein [Bemisia tabaci]|uniref:uncharacterized protein isoform X1 n=1 Tax=Bemisia tabaci TaxID=7038 RepID=UPI003B27D1BB
MIFFKNPTLNLGDLITMGDPTSNSASKDSVPQAMAFTVHFDNQKQSNNLGSNKFIKRHIRNLSLPLTNVYPSNIPADGGKMKKAGNHSEGYFSSDAEDDMKKSQTKFDEDLESPSSLPTEKLLVSPNEPHNFLINHSDQSDTESSHSETGTYTIDKEDQEVIKARLSIDKVFGVTEKIVNNCKREDSSWINDWASNVVRHNQQKVIPQNQPHRKSFGGFTKIPSPESHLLKRPLSTEKNQNLLKLDRTIAAKPQKFSPKLISKKLSSQPIEDFSDSSFETESFLRETQEIVSALENRVSLSVDSEGDSDPDLTVQNTSPKHYSGKILNKNEQSDSSCSESSSQIKAPVSDKPADKSQSTRYNRAFSLRKGRLDKPIEKPKPPHSPVAKPKPKSVIEVNKSPGILPPNLRQVASARPANTFSRTDCGRFSMRTSSTKPASPAVSTPKNVVNKSNPVKKKNFTPTTNGRSNSTLSLKEVEFQNWKRRKSYDPMKAAAEGRLKQVAAKKQSTDIMSQSVTSVEPTPKSPGNPVLRSASFHGVQQPSNNALISSEEDDEEMTISVNGDEYEWPVLQAAKSSQEPACQGSRISLHSNISLKSYSSRHTAASENCIDSDLIQVVLKLSNKLKGNSSALLKKLRILYDEDKVKCHQISSEIEQLECTSFPNSPSHSNPSLDLAKTFQNLKKISNFISVLDEVLFDEEEEFA